MTRKMFQVTRVGMIGIVIFICANLLLDKKVMVADNNIWARCGMLWLALFVFLAVSVLYERKRRVFSVGYLFLLVNVFINGVLCPCYFTDSRLREMERDGVTEPQDFYTLYLLIYFIIMALVLIYLLCVKRTDDAIKHDDFIKYDRNDDIAVFLMGIIVLFFNFRLGTTGLVLYVPVVCYFAIRFFCTGGKINAYTILGLLGGLYCIYRVRTNRFLVIEYIVPVILSFFVFVAVNDNRKKGKKVVPLLIFGIIAVLAYGMVSELVKLNLYYDRSYNILYEITNLKSIYDACVRQVYRLFGIWTELGGNIIQHVKVNGYFYGITYVKSFANYFGFDYVSLPLLSAKYISASYAQPGLIAEGYANFGVAGAVINMLIPFAIAEFCLTWFLKKRDPLSICILTVPFVKILCDGGTINYVLFGIATCIFAFGLYLILHWKRIRLQGYGSGDIRLFHRKRIEE
jgi:hypothetical protein